MGAVLSPGPGAGLDGVTAVVVTHLRPRLAGATVRSLLDVEGFAPDRVVVVVNGEGGLDDPALEEAVRMVRLPENTGPAGGFRRGLIEAFADPTTRWAYLCEDDMVLLHLPTPRVAGLLARVEDREHAGDRAGDGPVGPVGAVVPFGRVFQARSGHTVNVVPRRGLPGDLAPVEVTTWGATLVSRAVVDRGVLPDPELFFGFEDFDFYCRVRSAGFSVLVDVPCARQVAHRQTLAGRNAALRDHRPVDADEPWRAYYLARNYFALARRHGRPSWYAWHLLYSARRLQLAPGAAERVAIVRGLMDGARGRLGIEPRYVREVGERALAPAGPAPGLLPEPVSAPSGDGGDGLPTPRELGRSVVALVLSHNAPAALARCLDAIAAQSVPPAAVVVVDNASEPPLRVEGSTPGRPPVSVVRSEANLGPAGGWALAFENFADSSFDHAWVLDDDIVADPECLEVLLTEARKDPKAAFCFPRSVQPDGTVGEWGSWCGFVVSRHIVEQVGVPRAELFWWAEDNEYCHWRIPRAGFARRIVDGAVVQHDAVRQGDRVPLWKYYYEARNMLYLHLHVMHRVGWYPRNVTKLLGRAVLRERGRRLACLATIARGLADGARGRLGMRYPVEPMHEQAFPEHVAR
ncbi:MAG: glycosyltransferase [Acidimicrobiales bacterium]|nr:glycosyltransferase [Acidimicrobiales bacterium]